MKTISLFLFTIGFIATPNIFAVHPSGGSGDGESTTAGKLCHHQECMKAEKLKKFDANGDGKLDDAEKAAAKQAFEARKAEKLKKFDANGDGKLDDAEKAAAKKDRLIQHQQKENKEDLSGGSSSQK